MELMNLNHPASHKCAFCKYWYDPMNQAIRPKAPIVGFGSTIRWLRASAWCET